MLIIILSFTINSNYMLNLKLKYSKINWDVTVNRKVGNRNDDDKDSECPHMYPSLWWLYKKLHLCGNFGANVWKQFKSVWVGGCHTLAAGLFRLSQLTVLLFTSRVSHSVHAVCLAST